MPDEDFTLANEEDPNSRIAITPSTITYTGVRRDETAYVDFDKGVAHFNGNLFHQIDGIVTSIDNSAVAGLWMLANEENDIYTIRNVSGGPLQNVYFTKGGAPELRLQVWEVSLNVAYFATPIVILNIGTRYYLDITRDETVGSYGEITLDVYSDAARTTLVASTSLTLNDSKKDFQFVYGFSSFNISATQAVTGDARNLNLNEVAGAPSTLSLLGVGHG